MSFGAGPTPNGLTSFSLYKYIPEKDKICDKTLALRTYSKFGFRLYTSFRELDSTNAILNPFSFAKRSPSLS